MSHPEKEIHVRFNKFKETMQQIWENFCILEYYLPKTKDLLKSSKLPGMQYKLYVDNVPWEMPANKVVNSMQSIITKYNTESAFITSVTVFEACITDAILLMYKEFPERIPRAAEGDGTEKENHKVFNLVLDSTSIKQVIEKVAEEKVRSIFYGNPAHVFLKDKAKMQVGEFFKEREASLITPYIESTARRNIYIHNGGKVDSKYIKETKSNKALAGKRLLVSKDYLQSTLCTYEKLAGAYLGLIVTKGLRGCLTGRLKKAAERAGVKNPKKKGV